MNPFFLGFGSQIMPLGMRVRPVGRLRRLSLARERGPVQSFHRSRDAFHAGYGARWEGTPRPQRKCLPVPRDELVPPWDGTLAGGGSDRQDHRQSGDSALRPNMTGSAHHWLRQNVTPRSPTTLCKLGPPTRSIGPPSSTHHQPGKDVTPD